MKIRAAETVSINNDRSKIKYNVKLPKIIDGKSKFYYDGHCHNKKVEGIDVTELREVLIRKKTAENQSEVRITKGEVVGSIHSMVEADPQDEEQYFDWNLDDIKDKIDVGNITEVQKQRFFEAIAKVKPVLCKDSFDIGKAKVEPHKVELLNYSTIWQKPRTFSEPINLEIELLLL